MGWEISPKCVCDYVSWSEGLGLGGRMDGRDGERGRGSNGRDGWDGKRGRDGRDGEGGMDREGRGKREDPMGGWGERDGWEGWMSIMR